MKIVHLVLLLSLVGVSAACGSATVTEPEISTGSAVAEPRPAFNATTPPDTTSRDGQGPAIGTGT